MLFRSVIKRQTKETKIHLELNVDGRGAYEISTGIGFFNHMLELFTRHGRFDMKLSCEGDIDVDFHHTVEDVGIVMGQAFKEALGSKKGIRRYGSMFLPMDETLVLVSMDISGRSYLVYDVEFNSMKVFDGDEKERPAMAGAFDSGCALPTGSSSRSASAASLTCSTPRTRSTPHGWVLPLNTPS